VLQRAVAAVAVVLDLVDAEDVGVDREDRRHRLGPLPVELRLRVGAAAVGGVAAHAEGAVVDGVRQSVEGVEVVEQVHRGGAHVTTDLLGCLGAGVGRLEVVRAVEGAVGRRR
jgi:hypothetical protein